jgi:hypothetical protein
MLPAVGAPVFAATVLAAFTLLYLYVWWRVVTLAWAARRVSRWQLVGVGLALWVGLAAALILSHDGAGALTGVVEMVGMTAMASLFLVAIPLLAVDIVTGFGLLLRRQAPILRGWALAAGALLSVFALVQGLRPPVVSSFEVHLAGLPPGLDGTVVVAMSDLHLGAQLDERWLAGRVAQVEALHPDLVLLLGDLFEGHGRPQDEMLPALRRLSAPLGVWAVTGNHELHGRDDASRRVVEQAGIELLRDRWSEVRPGLVLAGVDGRGHERAAGEGDDAIRRALAGRPPGATIFLSHSPQGAETAAKAGAGLMLSGHTHGGQIWPFDLVVRRAYPLLGGRYQVEAMTVLVCRGTGTWGPRMRLWRPGEILRIVLRSSSSAA